MTATELRAALADDLDGLVRLHDREIDHALLLALAEVDFPDNFALLPGDDVRDAMRQAFNPLSHGDSLRSQKNAGTAAGDQLAADFAGIYLNGAIGASPYESVWLTDEHLTCQLPMFELRSLYQQAGLAVGDWRKRYDDHFVLQFQYLAHQLRQAGVPLQNIGRTLDEHVGHWFVDFARIVAQRADTDFYRALAILTADWLEKFRALIEDLTGERRTSRQVMGDRIKKRMAFAAGELVPLKFMPGGAPSAGPSL